MRRSFEQLQAPEARLGAAIAGLRLSLAAGRLETAGRWLERLRGLEGAGRDARAQRAAAEAYRRFAESTAEGWREGQMEQKARAARRAAEQGEAVVTEGDWGEAQWETLREAFNYAVAGLQVTPEEHSASFRQGGQAAARGIRRRFAQAIRQWPDGPSRASSDPEEAASGRSR